MIKVYFKASSSGRAMSTDIEHIVTIKEGFWVNVHGEYTVGEDRRFFIMPHMVDLIMVEEVESETET